MAGFGVLFWFFFSAVVVALFGIGGFFMCVLQ